MKRLLFLMVLAAGWFILESCSVCYYDAKPSSASVIGNYRMTHYNVPVPIDFDQDGDFSVNLLDESHCFMDTRLVLHANHTFTKTYNSVAIINGLASCDTENFSGTWSQSGSDVTLAFDDSGETDIYHFAPTDATLTKMEPSAYPNVDHNGVPYYDTGNVQMIFGIGF